MMKDASEGKDLYSAVAAKAFHTTYEECLEHFPKGTPIIKDEDGKWRYATDIEMCNEKYDKIADGENDTYTDGKARRTHAKVILLGMMYGRGPKALAEQLNCSTDEAKDIMNSVFSAFPKIKEFDTYSKEFAKKYGFTTTLWGRKRRLPDLALPEYEFDWSKSFVLENERAKIEKDVIKELKENYWDFDKKEKIKNKFTTQYGVKIKENGGFIAQAERQVLNARVQGSAADMTKKALIAVDNNKELKDLGFQLIVPVHDEILAQCPLANIKRCKELFTYEMSNAAKDKVDIKITVDPAISFAWYGEPISVD